jgi:hypothetical protein
LEQMELSLNWLVSQGCSDFLSLFLRNEA